MTRKKANRGKPGPKPGYMPAVNLRPRAATIARTLERSLEDDAYVAAVRKDPIRSGRGLRTMPYAELKLYAKGIDIPQHNIDELTPERLMQNCLMKVGTIVEALTE